MLRIALFFAVWFSIVGELALDVNGVFVVLTFALLFCIVKVPLPWGRAP